MKMYVNPDLCVGCGLCCDLCGSVFQLNDQGLAQAVAEPAPDQEADALSAMENCPVSAISEA